ncbi:MAG: RnfABCDGE type electron transport complex subunit B [bacterium]|nr:RnfABCDGE type electron transport complex subunit B [bacterium]
MLKFVLLSTLSVGGLGLLFGGLLAYAAKKLAVAVDERVHDVEKTLAGLNCGICGYAGCSTYAKAIVEEKAAVNLCAPGGKNTVEKIKQVLNLTGDHSRESVVARVRCQGDNKTVNKLIDYKGIVSCSAVSQVGGDKACSYGCMGYGDCENACLFDAIHIQENGLPLVDEAKCTGCGLCVKACPRNIIEMAPQSAYFFIRCVSKDFGPVVSRVCKKGCIGCNICAKVNNFEGIKMEDNLPVVDYASFKGDGTGAEKCPTKVIEFVESKFLARK